MNKTFSYKCDTDTLNALKRITGLTYIDNARVFNASPSGSNWSGSVGVG